MLLGISKKFLNLFFLFAVGALSACSGSLRGVSSLMVQDSKPVIVQTTLPMASGTYGMGTILDITIGFSKEVVVSGIPYLRLSTVPPVNAYYHSGSGSNALVFRYTVGAGVASLKVDYVGIHSLFLNGGSILSEGGMSASLTLPELNQGSSLSGLGGVERIIQIDTGIPNPATSLSWSQSTPSNSSVMDANWVPSTSADFAFSRVDLYLGLNCSGASPIQSVQINPKDQVTWRFYGTDSNTYSFKVVTFDTANNFTASACSGSLSLNLSPPNAATNLSWVESSPHFLSTTVTPTWTISNSPDVINQTIQFFLNPTCTLAMGNPITLGSGLINSYSMSVNRGAVYYYKVTSIDLVNWTTTSACSSGLVVPNWTVGMQGSIAAGSGHTCVNMNDGVYCWGLNNRGQVGNGGTATVVIPTKVLNINSAESISAGSQTTCAVVSGKAMCWGYNGFGGLGNNSSVNSSIPVQVQGLTSGVTAIAVGFGHACAIQNGAVFCWGRNNTGQLGNNSVVQSFIPVPVQGLTSGVTQISTAGGTVCAIQNGALKCWGFNGSGQLGDTTQTDRHVPTQVNGLTANVLKVSVSELNTCAIVSGVATCWGANNLGQVGNGTSGLAVLSPSVVSGLSGVQEISAGGKSHICAIANGAVYCWGSNFQGQLASNTNFMTNSPNPIPIAVTSITSGAQAIVSGDQHSCAMINGAMKCWGDSSTTQLGNGSNGVSNVPVSVTGVIGGIQQVAAGGDFNCAIVNGAARCWGSNADGQLGNNSLVNSVTPVQVSGLTSGVQSIHLGFNHACAVVNGVLKCWGRGTSGQLGQGFFASSKIPVTVSGITGSISDVSLGNLHTCAVINGGLRCWGESSFGQLGNASTSNSNISVAVQGMATGIQSVSLGAFHSCAIKNGSAYCWGINSNGQVGNGTTFQTLPFTNVPVQVTGFTSDVEKIASGGGNSCLINAGNLHCWGMNSLGQVGNGISSLSVISPAAITIPGVASGGVTSIKLGGDFSSVISDDLFLTWGNNSDGQLAGANNILSPSVVPTLDEVYSISNGRGHGIAIRHGKIYVWGSNSSGQLGNTSQAFEANPIEFNPW